LFGAQVRGQSGLYEKRISYLGQEIDDLVINQIISVMLFADAEVRVRATPRSSTSTSTLPEARSSPASRCTIPSGKG